MDCIWINLKNVGLTFFKFILVCVKMSFIIKLFTRISYSTSCHELTKYYVEIQWTRIERSGSEPWPGHYVVFLGKNSTQEYKWVPANCQGNLAKCWEGVRGHKRGQVYYRL